MTRRTKSRNGRNFAAPDARAAPCKRGWGSHFPDCQFRKGGSMAQMGSGLNGDGRSDGAGLRPHAYDPYQQPELFRGVAMRRMVAFLIDLLVLSIPVILAVIFIAV